MKFSTLTVATVISGKMRLTYPENMAILQGVT